MVPFSSESATGRDLDHLLKLTIRRVIMDFSPELQSFIENIQIFLSNAELCGTGDETDQLVKISLKTSPSTSPNKRTTKAALKQGGTDNISFNHQLKSTDIDFKFS